jgi:osmotically-inducible protein OsmY
MASETDNSVKESKISKNNDDAYITAQVKIALLTHRSTSAVKTRVSTNNGVVTLSGFASNDAEKELAGKLACDIKGVVSVVNKMAFTGKTAEECSVCSDLKDSMKCPLKNKSLAQSSTGE